MSPVQYLASFDDTTEFQWALIVSIDAVCVVTGGGGKSTSFFAEIYQNNNILFFTKINIIIHFPWGFAHIFSAVRT